MSPVRLLVVDADPTSAAAVELSLALDPALEGSSLVAARTLEAAGELLAGPFDLVVLEPQGWAIEPAAAVSRLLQSAREVPLLVWTQLDAPEVATAALHAGAIDWILKAAIPPAALGRVVRFAVLRDRAQSEQRALQGHLLAAQRMEGMTIFAGGLVHDFNNLLSAILANASLVKLDVEDPELKRRLSQIETAAHRAADLTHQLLSHARSAQPTMSAVDLGCLARECLQLLKVFTSGVSLELDEVPAQLPAVEGDSGQLQQALLNLLSNAVEASPAEGEVRLALRLERLSVGELRACASPPHEALEGEYLVLEVLDQGPGLAPGGRERLFRPFFTTKHGGRGLGLAAAAGIARAHRGALDYARDGERALTAFRLYLPARRDLVAVIAAAEADTDTWRGKGRVLVLDEDPAVLESSRALLRRMGLRAKLAASEAGALAKLDANPSVDFALVAGCLADAGARLRARQPRLRLILVSGDPTLCEAPAPYEALLSKPFGYQELKAVLRRLIDDRAPGRG